MTQSAVSLQGRRLEEHLGSQLIRRLNPGLARRPELWPGFAAGAGAATWMAWGCAWQAGRAMLASRRRGRRRAPGGSQGDSQISWPCGRACQSSSCLSSKRRAPYRCRRAHPVDRARCRSRAGRRNCRCSTSRSSPLAALLCCPLGSLRARRRHSRTAPAAQGHPRSGERSWSSWLQRLGVESGAGPRGELHFAEMGLVLSAAIEGQVWPCRARCSCTTPSPAGGLSCR